MIRILLSWLFTIASIFTPLHIYAGSQSILKADILEGIDVVKNYAGSKGHFEKNVNGWTGYDDGAASPVDCSGGTFGGSVARTTSSPLSGDGSLLWTKGTTSSVQGEGIAMDFTIDSKHKGSVLKTVFSYLPSSVFSDDQIGVYIYDVTNARLIQLSPYKILHTLVEADVQPMEFQTSIDSASYRLCLHVVGTDATNNWTIKLDDLKISKSNVANGVAVTDFKSYTPTFSASLGTTTLNYANWRQVGDHVEIEGSFVTGTVASGVATVSLPPGIVGVTRSATIWRGDWRQAGASTDDFTSGTFQLTSGATSLNFADDFSVAASSGSPSSAANANVIFRSASTVSFNISLKVAGWSSNTIMSSDAANRPIYYYAYGQLATGTITTTPSVAVLGSYDQDNSAGYNTSTGLFTVKHSDVYFLSGKCNISGTNSGSDYVAASFMLNGSSRFENFNRSGTAGDTVATSASVYLLAGSTIGLGCRSSMTTPIYSNGLGGTWFSIANASGKQQIAASEKVYLQYTNNAGTVLTGGTTKLDFSTKVADSYNSWDGDEFTAPRADWYCFNGSILITAAVAQDISSYIDGASQQIAGAEVTADNVHMFAGCRYLLAGQKLSFIANTNATLSNSAIYHVLSISAGGN